MFLAAHSLGIGSVWINQLRDISDKESVRTIFRELGIPDSQVAFGTAALGYAAEPEKGKIEKKNPIRVVL
jgi:nitroreductase